MFVPEFNSFCNSIAAIALGRGVTWQIMEKQNVNSDAMTQFARDVLVPQCACVTFVFDFEV